MMASPTQLWWGLTQPFAGAFADRVGAGRVFLLGVSLVALGTFIIPFMTTTLGLIFAIGVLAAGGAGMTGPAVLMAATMRLLPLDKRGMATGIVNAGGSFGQFLMDPIAGALMVSVGWGNAMQVMACIVLLALWTPSFLLLAAGFFVCGFHAALLATHLPGVVASCGLPTQWGAWALGILGLFNIVGSLTMGWAVGRWRMKSLLSLVYAVRAVAVLVFLLAPKTGPVLLVFAAVMGVSFLSTVPPTAGLVAKFFGTSHMATLFGLVMFDPSGGWFSGRVFRRKKCLTPPVATTGFCTPTSCWPWARR